MHAITLALLMLAGNSPADHSSGDMEDNAPSGISFGGSCYPSDAILGFGASGGVCGVQQIYSDGSDLFILTQAIGSTGALLIALGDNPPSPDDNVFHVWKGTTAASCGGNDTVCIEKNGTNYIRMLATTASYVGFQFGDDAASGQGGVIYGLSTNATDAGVFNFSGLSNVKFLRAGVGVFQFQQATPITTTAGNLTLSPAGELSLNPSASVSSTYSTRNGFAKNCTTSEETVTFAGGGGDVSKTTSGLIPDGATQIAVAARVLVAGTICGSADYGNATTADLYGDNIAVSVGTTVDPSDYTATVNYNAIAAEEVKITGVGGNCADLSVRVVAHYCTYTAPLN